MTLWIFATAMWADLPPLARRQITSPLSDGVFGVAGYIATMLMPIIRAPVSVRGRCVLPGANTT